MLSSLHLSLLQLFLLVAPARPLLFTTILSRRALIGTAMSTLIVDPSPTPSPTTALRYIDSEYTMQYSDKPRSRGMLLRRYTGESTPYTFKKVPIKLVKQVRHVLPKCIFQPYTVPSAHASSITHPHSRTVEELVRRHVHNH